MEFDFGDLMNRLEQLIGRRVRVLYMGVVAEEKVPIDPESRASGMKIRWAGRLTRIRCVPGLKECQRFHLRPQRLVLYFDRGLRVLLGADQLVGYRHKGETLLLLLKRGLSVLFVPII